MAKIFFGGDYNPEQWPEHVRAQDSVLLDAAHIDTVTIGTFSWTRWHPGPDRYDFSDLDRIVERAAADRRGIVLATPTGARPAWLSRQFPEVDRVDFQGRPHRFGVRHNACPNSPVFRAESEEIASRLAERYGRLSNLRAWHIGNEFGGACYCDRCAVAFRAWLRDRYGTLEELNGRWYTDFWSHTFTDWDEIWPPNALTEHWNGRPTHTAFQAITLDYKRFNSDSLLACFTLERDAIRRHPGQAPITTNLMGAYEPLDYFRWARELDFVSWDNYPPDMSSQARMALFHDLMRGLKNGDPFWVMEQTPTMTSTRDVNPIKRPGVMRLWSYQSIAHGADAVLFFQLRQSRGASEKFHGAVINHAGRSDTRFFTEVAELGAELERLDGEIVGGRTHAYVAMIFDWNAWWALEMSDGPSRLARYLQVVQDWYAALYRRNIAVDLVAPDAELSGYRLICAPALFLVRHGLPERVERAVRAGARFLTGCLSGRVDENDLAFLADMPGPFANLCGIRIDETDALPPGRDNQIAAETGETYPCSLVFDLVQTTSAEPIAHYTDDFYAGMPVVTRNAVGAGAAWYAGSLLDARGLDWLFGRVLDDAGVAPVLPDVVFPVEATDRRRAGADGGEQRYLFLLNHGSAPADIIVDRDGVSLFDDVVIRSGGSVQVPPNGVVIIRSDVAAAR